MSKHRKTDIDYARDEVFAHIHRCGVLKATPDQQQSWIDDTVEYIADRYPALAPEELAELKEMTERFCAPVIPHGKQHTALTQSDGEEESPEASPEESDDTSEREMAAAV